MAPLWFTNSLALARSLFIFWYSRVSSGKWTPSGRIFYIWLQRGYFGRRVFNVATLQNLDPYLRWYCTWDFIAGPRYLYLESVDQLFLAAYLDSVKENSTLFMFSISSLMTLWGCFIDYFVQLHLVGIEANSFVHVWVCNKNNSLAYFCMG